MNKTSTTRFSAKRAWAEHCAAVRTECARFDAPGEGLAVDEPVALGDRSEWSVTDAQWRAIVDAAKAGDPTCQ
jgi:hypothetical protein